MKLFQTALKLHAQGPRFFDDASDAYNALFESEIFKYPESKTEYERTELQPYGPSAIEPALTQGLDVTGGEADVGSSINQALYLSHKNHGHFLLDRIKSKARTDAAKGPAVFEDDDVLDDARTALDSLNAALDRDPSDAEVWRRTARLAAFLKSARISRYSLEAAIELDDDPTVVDVEPPSLAEGYAGKQLKTQLEVLGDEMALSHPAMKIFREKELPTLLKRYLDPLPFLPNPAKKLAIPRLSQDDISPPRLVVNVPRQSWSELGMALVQFQADQGLSGQAIFLDLPDALDEDIQMEIDKQLQEAQAQSKSNRPVTKAKAEGAPKGVSKDSAAQRRESQSAVVDAPTASDPPSKESGTSLPSRKRSQSAAGLQETPEDDQADTKRSKRTRRRDTAVEEAMDPAALLATQLQPYQAADQNLFQTTKNILENLGVTDSATLGRIDEVLDSCASDDRSLKMTNPANVDLRDSIVNFDDASAKILLSKKELPQLSLSAFLEHAKSGSQPAPEVPVFDETRGVKDFVEKVNAGWYTIHDLAFEWVSALSTSYTKFRWSDQLKTAMVQVTSKLDESIYERIAYELERDSIGGQWTESSSRLHGLVHMLFEIHIDVYERVTNPNSVVDSSVRAEAMARMNRWLDVAAETSRSRPRGVADDLSLRFLWATIFSNTLLEGVSREHILACWDSLRDYLQGSDVQTINIPNNAVLSEISVAAADREISKLTTMDFFLGLFQEDIKDPVALIDTLEPVLNPESVYVSSTVPAAAGAGAVDGDDAEPKETRVAISECAGQDLRDLWKFISSSSTELRLFLWGRLGEAYDSIKYTTKQFSCFLKAIEMIVADFERETYGGSQQESRRKLFIGMLKSLDDQLIQALHLAVNDNSSFDIIDEEHIRSTASALAKVSSLLHVAAVFEDEIRIGIKPAPATGATFTSFLTKLREMQVRTWCLQYTVLKVGISQNPTIFPKPENDLVDYLAAVHQVLGLRKCCKASNKIFLRVMRVELLKQQNIENWEDHLGQVLYDLHGLKLGVGIWEVQDHGCPPEKLEKRPAMALVGKITTLANRMSMKDLLKSELKNTIEDLQQAIGSTKSTPQMIYNLRNFTEYLRKPIHPLRLFQALSGNITLDAVNVNTPESALAAHGWFFLLGMIALTKFKAVDLNRRQTPGATDDLRIGATFLRLQLQFTPDRWDAWFRLAECFDYELDETVLWTADKMNKDRPELVKFQRNAIHCYTLALSYSRSWTSESSALASQENEDALYDLYHTFAMRLYASSREPFAMEPFKHGEQERFFIETMGAGTYKKILHEEMSDYKVWKFAASLFKRAMPGRPKDWKNPYMLSKCLWKMYQKPLDSLDAKDKISRPAVQTVIKALEKTIEVVMTLPKPRHGQDPILEPHYKIVTVVHKLVMRGDMAGQEAADILHRQPYAPPGEDPVITDGDDWESYVLKSLRHLRDKDKSNWQHRMIIRHARILFEGASEGDNENAADDEDNGGKYVSAKAAFLVLRESMFTKTMVMNVWKCDAERPGRHHVYTEQYIRLLVRLLSVMNDRTNMEAVLRRIRKKSIDFYHFNELWQTCVVAYLRLIRSGYRIPYTEEDVFKSLTSEDFDGVGERIADWVTTSEAEDHRGLAALKEVVELKKLNANLMKAGPIDDLISDCYSLIYVDLGPDPAKAAEEQEKAEGEKTPGDASEAKEAKPSALEGFLNGAGKEPTVLGSLRASSEQPEKAPTPGEQDKKPRRAGVRRPDILRKAELAVVRAAEGPPKATESRGKGRLGSISSGKKSTTPGAGADAADDSDGGEGSAEKAAAGDDVEMKEVPEAADGAASDVSSPPASVHDSADDESDLSDVPPDYEDDIPPSLMFPNLRRSADAGTDGEESSAGSSDEASEDGDEADGEDNTEIPHEGEGEEEGDGEGEGEGEQDGEEEEEEEGEEEEEEEGEDEGDDEGEEEGEGEGEGEVGEEGEDTEMEEVPVAGSGKGAGLKAK